MNLSPTDTPAPSAALRGAIPGAGASLGATELAAVACIALGWFGLATLVTDYGAFSVRFHFYNAWTLLASPARLLTGMQSGDGAQSCAFGLLCVLALLGVLLPLRNAQRTAWLAYLAPLALMLVCGLVLYHEGTLERFADSGRYGALESQTVRLANLLNDRMAGAVARRISLGAGAYLAFVGSLLLAVRGVQRYRAGAPAQAAALDPGA